MNGKSCFPGRCPMCLRDTEFRISLERIGLIGAHLTGGVVCRDCGARFDHEDQAELRKLPEIAQLYEAMQAGKLPLEEGMKRMEHLDSAIIRAVHEESTTWLCSGCGEENYMSFMNCWKCHCSGPFNVDDLEIGETRPLDEEN